MNYIQLLITPMLEVWFYDKLFFEMEIIKATGHIEKHKLKNNLNKNLFYALFRSIVMS